MVLYTIVLNHIVKNVRIFKTKLFNKWAKKQNVSDDDLREAIEEIENGLYEANLGGCVYKKRVALEGKGKSGGARTIIAYKVKQVAFFIYAFNKNEKSNITDKELEAFKIVADKFVNLSNKTIKERIKEGVLFEVVKKKQEK